ncbi:aspartate aminotransferase family protein [Kitasatospora sp. NPDC101157]|uniref:aspartate aminotransferase family protein n=1 Tax=Kitasatospora sp. NPDC101157 TaxID=3364098 RepID=UPI003816743C
MTDQRMVRGEGVYLYDQDGRAYLDCGAGTFNMSLGYQHPAVVQAIKDQADQLIDTAARFQTDPVNKLARRLVDLAPSRITKAHLNVSSGSTANEGAIKMAQHATGKRDVVTTFRAHVGQTMWMLSLSGNAFRKQPFPMLVPGSLQVPDPYCFRCFYAQEPGSCRMMCVDRINDFLEYASSGNVAAILVEAISGNGGNIVPPPGYFQQLRSLCDEHGIMLILDEIQTGIGRTGRMFAAEHFGVEPDAMTLGKGLGGSGAAVAAILASEPMTGLAATEHSFTYGTNLMASAAALATLDVIDDEAFLANVRATGARIMERLALLQTAFPVIGDVRGVGLMIGIEIVGTDRSPNVELANLLAEKAMEHGLIIRPSRSGKGNVLKIKPPLVLTLAEADLICDRLEQLFRAHCR